MDNQIIITKIWQDIHVQQFRFTCNSNAVSVVAKVYLCQKSIEELTQCMMKFLRNTKRDQMWYNGDNKTQSIPYIAFGFRQADSRGHIVINISIHDQDSNMIPYSVTFCIQTELGALGRFAQELSYLPTLPINTTIYLYDPW